MTYLANYAIQREIGSGSFGTVFLSYEKKTYRKVALKVIYSTKEFYINEYLILSLLDTSYFPKILSVEHRPDSVVIAQEFCEGVNLEYLVSKNMIPGEQKFNICKQLIDAVFYLHQHCIVHRDIKLENIIISPDYKIKLCDFGFSRFVEPGEIIDEFMGSTTYVSPEVENHIPYSPMKNDIWCMGICILKIYLGDLTFTELTDNCKICNFYTVFEPHIGSFIMRNVLRSVLVEDENRRADFAKIYSILGENEKSFHYKLPSYSHLDIVTVKAMSKFNFYNPKFIDQIKNKEKGIGSSVYSLLFHQIYKNNKYSIFDLNDLEISALYRQNIQNRYSCFFCSPKKYISFDFFNLVTFKEMTRYLDTSCLKIIERSPDIFEVPDIELLLRFSCRSKSKLVYSVKIELLSGTVDDFANFVELLMTRYSRHRLLREAEAVTDN